MTTRWFSLRRRLLLPLLIGVSLCWLLTLAWSYADAHHEIDELFDAQLAQTAQSVLALGRRMHDLHEREEDSPRDREVEAELPAGHPYQRRVMFQIWHEDGALALRSPNAPSTPLTETDGYSEEQSSKGHWRYFAQWDERHRHRVVVAESHHVRDELIGHIALRLLLPALFGLPLLAAWVWLATRRGLAPLAAVADEIASREPARLHALTPKQAPEEIRPLVQAINDLFARVAAAIEAERRFTADAAHELRTPLAALDAQAQVALRAQDEAERRRAIEQLRLGVGRAGRLIGQLLTLARLDPEKGLTKRAVALHDLTEEVCARLGPMAIDKDVTLELETEPTIVAGDPDMLRVLIRNLLDNALRYTPTGGRVAVSLAGRTLTVADTGPGIPAAERERVFDRFHRLAGQETEGSGLGLSIVRRIAELHDADISLDDADGGGLAVRLRFPETSA